MHRIIRRKMQELEHRLYSDLPGPKHHKLQRAHRHTSEEIGNYISSPENISYVNPIDHKSWTYLIGDATPKQAKKLLNIYFKNYRPNEMVGMRIELKYLSKKDMEDLALLKPRNSFLNPLDLSGKIVFEKFIGKKSVEKSINKINHAYITSKCKFILVKDARNSRKN